MNNIVSNNFSVDKYIIIFIFVVTKEIEDSSYKDNDDRRIKDLYIYNRSFLMNIYILLLLLLYLNVFEKNMKKLSKNYYSYYS